MKSNLNNVDEFFREGLNNLAHEPESGLWKKISGRLLWREVMRLNFTNIPSIWTGFAAAGVIATSLLVYNLLPSGNNQATVTENVQAYVPVVHQENPVAIAQNAVTTIPDGHPEMNFPESGGAENRQQPTTDITQKPAQPTGSVAIAESVENPVNGSKTEPGTGAVVSEDINKTPDSSDPVTTLSESFSGSEIKEEVKVNKSSGNLPDEAVVVTSGSALLTVPSESQKVVSPGIVTENTDDVINSSKENIEISRVNPLSYDDSEITDNQTYVTRNPEKVNTYGEQLLALNNSVETKNEESRKIQKMNSLSYSLGNLFKGKYKPPKRDFDEGAMDLYRGKTKYFSAEAYGAFEMTDYTRIASTSHEKSYLGGASISYHNTQYVLQGGFELSYQNDVSDYMVDMSTYDSVGFYYGVGEFVVDPENPDSVIFVIQTVTVYDSVQHQSTHQTPNNYTFLQVPLMIGFKAMQLGRFSAYLKAGPSFSFMLNKTVPEFEYSNPEATVHNINNYSLPRLTTSIQALLSLSLQYQISDRVGVLVEPTYRYYIQGVYDVNGEDLKKPYAVGVRGGIYYNFW